MFEAATLEILKVCRYSAECCTRYVCLLQGDTSCPDNNRPFFILKNIRIYYVCELPLSHIGVAFIDILRAKSKTALAKNAGAVKIILKLRVLILSHIQ